TLSGTGTVVFASSDGRTSVRPSAGGTTLTVGPGITLRGQTGWVGYNPNVGGPANVSVVNHGTLSPDVARGPLVVRADSGWSSDGALQALSGGTLNLQGPGAVAGAGVITAGTNATLNLQGSVTNTGSATLTAAAGGTINLSSTLTNSGSSATLNLT